MEELTTKINEFEFLMNEKGYFFKVKKDPPLKKDKLKSLQNKLNLNEELISFYGKFNGLFITWFSDSVVLCLGRIYIPELETLEKYITKTEKTDLKHYSEYLKKGYIPFDVDNINKYITFIKTNAKKDYELIRVDANFSETKLSITIEKYLFLAISVGGLYHWQNYISKEVLKDYEKYSYDGFYNLIVTKLKSNILDEFYFKKDLAVDTVFVNPIFNIPNEAQINIRKENSGCSNVEIRRAEIGLKNKLPKDLIFYFYNRNGLEISWKYQSYHSNFELVQIEKIFGGNHHSRELLWNNNYFKFVEADKSFKNKFSKYYPLIIEESGNTVFTIENNTIQLFFIKTDLEPVMINLTFNSFIEKLYECCGISGWQNFFTGQCSTENPLIKDLIQGIQICFPNININDFIKNQDLVK